MKTLILNSGKEIGCVPDEYIPLENEILLSILRVIPMNEAFWNFNKKEFFDNHPDKEIIEPIIQEEISSVKFFLALYTQLGLTIDIIEDKINKIPIEYFSYDQKMEAIIMLKKSGSFVRSDITLNAFAQVMQISKEQLDNLFKQ